MIGSIALIGIDKEIGGSILGGGSLIALVSLFVTGKNKQSKNLEKKRKQIDNEEKPA